MGSLFSAPKATAPTAEQQARLDALRKTSKAQQVAAAQAAHDAKQVLASQFERQKQIAKQRIAEIKTMIARAKELRDARKALNLQSAVLLCALYHNYPFGRLDTSAMDNTQNLSGDITWASNAESIVKIALNEKVFWIMVKIPQLLPLFWPTGDTEIEQKFHEYTQRDSKSVPIPEKYEIDINTHLEAYVTKVLPNMITNVFQANCQRDIKNNTDAKKDMFDACAALIASVELVQTDEELLYRLTQFIKNDDHMNYKCFVARSGKTVCSKQIMLVPSTFPKRCPRYELYEAILMITNTILNQYGECQAGNGAPVAAKITVKGTRKVTKKYSTITEEQKKTLAAGVNYKPNDLVDVMENEYAIDTDIEGKTEGGMCFAINEAWMENCWKHAIGDYSDKKQFWDGKTYVPVNNILLTDDKITGEADHTKWMKVTGVHKKTEPYYLTDSDEALMKGYVRWQNPTKRFTYEFLNDREYMEFTFKLPLLNANLNDMFRTTFLYNAYNTLTTAGEDKEASKYDPYRTINKNLMYSLDFMTMVPPQQKSALFKECSPLSRYMYTLLIEYSCKWHLSIPIVNCMSMGKINNAILHDPANKDDKATLPQNIWARTKNFKYNANPGNPLKEMKAPAQQTSNATFTGSNVIDLSAAISAAEAKEKAYDDQVKANKI